MELTIEQALQQGVAAHKEGKLQDAERLYRAILQVQSLHPVANHNLGVLAVLANKANAALPLFKTAVEANPKIEQFWLSYIDALIKEKQYDNAKQVLEQAKKQGVAGEKFNIPEAQLASKNTPEYVDSSSPSQVEINALLEHYENGRFGDAEKIAISITQKFPQYQFAWKVLGAIFGQTGRNSEASHANQTAVALSPRDAEAHSNLGIMLQELGRLDEAEASYTQAIALKPDDAEAHSNLGNTLKELGRLDEAEASYRQAIALKPDYAEVHSNLGVTLQELGRLDEAEALFTKAISLKPDHAEAHSNLGNTLKELGRLEQAEASYAQAIALKPDYADAHRNLGIMLQERGKLDRAEASYTRVISLKPDDAEAYSNLGVMLRELGRLDEAETSLTKAIMLKLDYAQAHSNLGVTLRELGRLNEAEASLTKAIALEPDHAEAHYNLGNTLKELERLDEAEVRYRQAIALKPDYYLAWDNLLFVLNYQPRLGSAELYREYAAYGTVAGSAKKRQFSHGSRPSVANGRIRIGYSSPDFCSHACRFFIEPMVCEHNRDHFELFAYSNTAKPDHHTERFKGYFDHWIDVTQLSDEAMAERIYDDGIDILVDMAGHTKGNRLVVFAMRPAPIQVGSAIGYGYTTGLKEIDYFIGDENLTPEGSEPYFSEKLFRIPAPQFAYESPRDTTPDVSDLPALRNGYVTFGSLTRTVRLNDPLLAVWKKILDRVPGSRLRLDQEPFVAEGAREFFWTRLECLGIPRERVELAYSHPHWQAYQDIDITLDCWPHNGGTTTIESLWMGVPVLSKVDRPSVGCVGASILKPLALEDWVVEDEIAYVEKAVAYASNLATLAHLRGSLRQRLERSSLLDAAACTQKIEAAYRQMLAERG